MKSITMRNTLWACMRDRYYQLKDEPDFSSYIQNLLKLLNQTYPEQKEAKKYFPKGIGLKKLYYEINQETGEIPKDEEQKAVYLKLTAGAKYKEYQDLTNKIKRQVEEMIDFYNSPRKKPVNLETPETILSLLGLPNGLLKKSGKTIVTQILELGDDIEVSISKRGRKTTPRIKRTTNRYKAVVFSRYGRPFCKIGANSKKIEIGDAEKNKFKPKTYRTKDFKNKKELTKEFQKQYKSIKKAYNDLENI
ncbi:hypothetical protein AMET1_0357 [Methanonatronarchaeum thermophilum]|uniref:Uncharacterized protein n=1 Tax=Methanonatronarchaeum thermophilum TaxID=1927129 RepID=A0A1Y3GBA4_9EURY|nr:hypothetical protein [Methanonatronarchaeum thermophilum]OUJ18708.1 hypothetical protein AMET1_0357 [Methanonatronarchaeum thermophilum]